MGRGDPANGQWARLEPLLPRTIGPGRPPVWTRRRPADGIPRRTRTGAPWRDVPERHGPWDRVHDLLRRAAAGRHLGGRPHPAPGRDGRGGSDHLGRRRRLHHLRHW
ncbi:transposase [Streptomyces sp. enrichment culture]|uniref:transposase n=1 Tax=Streptomyces sp. enrichment culture TaxID=1795815 RepID=UPI003F54F180